MQAAKLALILRQVADRIDLIEAVTPGQDLTALLVHNGTTDDLVQILVAEPSPQPTENTELN